MPRCDLRIEFEQGSRSFVLGGTIQGLVRVRVEADADCKALKLTQEWRTHGKGNVDKGVAHEQVLYQGPWQAGEERTYPFSIPVPCGPMTYHGRYVNVDWYLRARADIPWAIDPKAEEEFLVGPAEGMERPYLGPAYHPPAAGSPAREAFFLTFAKGAFAFGLVVGGGLLWLAYRAFCENNTFGAIQMGLGGAIVGIVALVVAYVLGRNALAQRTLGPVSMEIADPVVRRGGQVAATLSFSPVASADMTQATLKLKAQETAVSGGGTNETTHTHALGGWIIAQESGRSLSPGMSVRLAGSAPIPADAAATFASSSNRVTWSVEAEIRLAGKPDWKKELTIAVLP